MELSEKTLNEVKDLLILYKDTRSEFTDLEKRLKTLQEAVAKANEYKGILIRKLEFARSYEEILINKIKDETGIEKISFEEILGIIYANSESTNEDTKLLTGSEE